MIEEDEFECILARFHQDHTGLECAVCSVEIVSQFVAASSGLVVAYRVPVMPVVVCGNPSDGR